MQQLIETRNSPNQPAAAACLGWQPRRQSGAQPAQRQAPPSKGTRLLWCTKDTDTTGVGTSAIALASSKYVAAWIMEDRKNVTSGSSVDVEFQPKSANTW